MKKVLTTVALAAAASLAASGAYAQSGAVGSAVAGYSWDEAAQEAPGTKDFHSNDGILTFAVVTHTAGNGFFDPVYVGATVAANMIGARVLLLGSESPADDPARAIEIINQILQDPTLDGLIMTTPQAGAYDDIVRTAERNGIPVATTNSFDGGIYNRLNISHTGQDASAAAIAGDALAKCLIDRGVQGGSIILPNDTAAMGNIEVNNRVTSAYNAIVAGLNAAGVLGNFTVDAGPEGVGVSADQNDPVNSIISLIESRGDVVGAFAGNNVFTPALAQAVAQTG
jgi:simple sugar transport system substrate-binding protein